MKLLSPPWLINGLCKYYLKIITFSPLSHFIMLWLTSGKLVGLGVPEQRSTLYHQGQQSCGYAINKCYSGLFCSAWRIRDMRWSLAPKPKVHLIGPDKCR